MSHLTNDLDFDSTIEGSNDQDGVRRVTSRKEAVMFTTRLFRTSGRALPFQ